MTGNAPGLPGTTSRLPGLTGFVHHHPIASFLILAYTIGWVILMVPVLAERGVISFDLPAAVPIATVLALAFPALIITSITGGRSAVRQLLRRLVQWRFGWGWWVLVVLGLPLATLGLAVVTGFGSLNDPETSLMEVAGSYLWRLIYGAVTVNLLEEMAWFGFVQTTLENRHTPMRAALATAPLFALIHLPLLLMPDQGPIFLLLPALVVFAIPFRILLAWVSARTGRSLLAVGLLHAASNATNDKTTISRFVGGEDVSILQIGILFLAAILIAVVTRGRLGHPRVAGTDTLEVATGRV